MSNKKLVVVKRKVKPLKSPNEAIYRKAELEIEKVARHSAAVAKILMEVNLTSDEFFRLELAYLRAQHPVVEAIILKKVIKE
jgi:hypothetical protein